jgi:7-keto-8-aminopelargonate synthetase-like enzyme
VIRGEFDMNVSKFQPASVGALSGSVKDFRAPKGNDLLERVNGFFDWQDERRTHGLWPYSRATVTGPRSTVMAQDDTGRVMTGVNFASQDYLSLSGHPEITATAIETVEKYGVHSAGSPALVGNSGLTLALERRIAEFLQMEHVVLYPTGWAAGYGAIRGLVRSADHIVIDSLSHACLQEGANAATRNIYMHRHLDVEHCRHWLRAIRAKDSENAILVVTEALFSMDSDTPDLAALQSACREYNATLLVDVAHDLGALGPGGRGHIATAGMLGQVDLVMGSFSKTFASNGGFVASNSRAVKEYLKYYSPTTTFSNALSQVQAATVLKAIEIVDSAEGDALRDELMANVLHLRARLTARGLEIYGDPSAIVAVKMGSEPLARLVSRRLHDAGLLANLVEYPAVGKGAARFRMQVMAKHTHDNIEKSVEIMARCRNEALLELSERDFGPQRQVA